MQPFHINPASIRQIVAALAGLCTPALAQAATDQAPVHAERPDVQGAKRINPTTVEILLADQHRVTLDFYGKNIFRWFRDDSGGLVREPESDPKAQILVDQPRKKIGKLRLSEQGDKVIVQTANVAVEVDRKTGLMKVTNLQNKKVVLNELSPMAADNANVTLTFEELPDEYFYGGGVQNGRFSHKGKSIVIENQNSWTDGGVASPNPFYWSTRGYGILWHTFKPGRYDFGAAKPGEVKVSHETNYLDVFVMVDDKPAELLADFYQLTGNPVLLPKFGFYQGHLNAYNRDYWKEDEKGIPFEDGKIYKESQKDETGIKESLNGEKDNYQFSARAVVNRYQAHDMPLGWVLPNDGYGAGYGQTDTLDGNIANLRDFGDYARQHGVQIGLWTQSDLHPKADVSPLLQRDLVKEVRDAGVRVLKTDVAWVGAGYSFGLHGVADAAQIMTYYGNDSRPFIISLDGWAGTQRYAGVWTGDQTGGQWEYIRFHIPTYIGAGLSGLSNICSDMDGIFGGKNPVVNTRDYQWKTFTAMELNMDGWGANMKYPHALGEPATSINRWYLKLKSELMPYTYSLAKQAVNGLPMVRAMFLDDPNAYTLGAATRYQFLYGPSFLVAPIYKETRKDEAGNDMRNNIYLPKGEWIDWFTGEIIAGGRVINNIDSPLWKLPVFVKRGAIIPTTPPHNHAGEIPKSARMYEFYPHGKSSFTEYDDDGTTEAYKSGAGATTRVESEASASRRVTLTIHPTQGGFDGFEKMKSTELLVNVSEAPVRVLAEIGGKEVELAKAETQEELMKGENLYYYEEAPNLNRFATLGSDFAKQTITKNSVLHVKIAPTDTTANAIIVTVEGYRYEPEDTRLVSDGSLTVPAARITDENIGTYTLLPTWDKVANADYYEIEFGGMLYSTIRENEFLFEDLKAETAYSMKLRAVNKAGTSAWVNLQATTKSNPLEFAIAGITAKSTAPDQGGSGISKLFDFDEATTWHTKWQQKAVPFEFTMSLPAVHQLEKLRYFPRDEAGNGTLVQGTISYSMDNIEWTEAGKFDWEPTGDMKEFAFVGQPMAGYLKIAVANGVGDFGSGKELYVFQVPGSESYIPGDINHDNKIDRNDLVSYGNYTGLRKGDADFEGYISKGDINRNGLIDAYDISTVATKLDGGVSEDKAAPLAGKLTLTTPKTDYEAGETVEITVSGEDLAAVNALSFALPYNPQDFSYVGTEAIGTKKMENFTNDRLHTDGAKVIYPTFVNVGAQDAVDGSGKLLVIKFTAKRKATFQLKPTDGLLVDKHMNFVKPW